MILLSLDSSNAACSAAVCRDGVIVANALIENGNTHAQQLMPLTDQVLNACDCSIDQVDALVCVMGPGSFTGVRIGVCTVRAMALAAQKPVIAVSALEVLANIPFEGVVCSMIDARHQQVYCAVYQQGNTVIEPSALYVVQLLEQIAALNQKCLFVGNGAKVYQEDIIQTLGDLAVLAPQLYHQVTASGAAVFAMEHCERMASHDTLMPLYLRASQAEREAAQKAVLNG